MASAASRIQPEPVTLSDGRTVGVADTAAAGGADPDAPVVFWHRGSPHTGALFEPLLGLARAEGVRMIVVARPGYGLSTPLPGRSVARAAADGIEVADLLGIDRFAAMGDSGGGPHAIAAAALHPDRVAAVAVVASPAPFVDRSAWWDGMRSDRALRSAVTGREARLALEEEFDPEVFTASDWALLDEEWGGLGADAGAAGDQGGPGLADDDVALVRPWGIDLADVRAPVLLVHGRDDRMIPPAHADLIAAALPDATVWWREGAGHVAALAAVPDALGWVLQASPFRA